MLFSQSEALDSLTPRWVWLRANRHVLLGCWESGSQPDSEPSEQLIQMKGLSKVHGSAALVGLRKPLLLDYPASVERVTVLRTLQLNEAQNT